VQAVVNVPFGAPDDAGALVASGLPATGIVAAGVAASVVDAPLAPQCAGPASQRRCGGLRRVRLPAGASRTSVWYSVSIRNVRRDMRWAALTWSGFARPVTAWGLTAAHPLETAARNRATC